MHNEGIASTRVARLLRVTWFAVLVVAVLTTLGFVAQYWWFLEYCCHFRLQYSYMLFIALVIFCVAKRMRQAVVVTFFLIVNLATMVPYYTGTPARGDAPARLRLVSANVGASNRQQDRIVKFVQDVDPDFVLLFEANDTWETTVETLAADFPYAVLETKSGHFSTVLLSRYPLSPTIRKRFGRRSIYALVTECNVNGQRLKLIAAHLLPPYMKSYVEKRNNHLNDLADEAANHLGPVVLAGDLNLTPWSPHFKAALRRGGLTDARHGFGLQPTWPSVLPGMRIPIDQCLVTPDITIHSWKRGPHVGSDHLPIVVEFSLDETQSDGREG